MKVHERFLQYVAYDTQSKEESSEYPSTAKQLLLGRRLLEDLQGMGIPTTMDQYGYVIGKMASNTDFKTRKLALIAHMDTSPDASGSGIQARIVPYEGGDIILNAEAGLVLSPSVFPALKKQIGRELIVTDGTTLLGADDKAGVAEIMTIAEELSSNPEIPHGELVFVFTPDEEVGNGTKYLDIHDISADFAYTLDGSEVEEIAYENFNAAAVKITIVGKSVHPGSAKNKMVNSIRLAQEFDALLPEFARPEITEGYEGFNHLHGIEGSVEKTIAKYLIRNHDKVLFEGQKRDFENARDFLNRKYGYEAIRLEIIDSYYNMREILEHSMYVVDIAKAAMRDAGIVPHELPIRGGTDGARLTYLGLPCPNLGTGGYNYHGPFEYASIPEMEIAVDVLRNIIAKVARQA